MKHSLSAIAFSIALVTVAPAEAQSLDGVFSSVDFSVNGFGTAGAVLTNTNGAEFVRGLELSGATKKASESVDSNLGVQGTARFNSWLSATVQILESRNVEADTLAWAYLKIDPLSNLSFKVGKVGMPLFMISDSREIGYANTWVRPPNEVYALSINEELKGGEATYVFPVGVTHLAVTAYAGNSVAALVGANFPSWDVRGGELRWESEWVTLRGSYMSEEQDLNVFYHAVVHDKYTFSGFGASTDHENIVAQAEWVKRTSKLTPAGVNATGWYFLGGYRFGTVLPYVTLASTSRSKDYSFFYVSGNQDTKAAGVRWDAFKSADIKFQVERIDPKAAPGIGFINAARAFGNSEVTVATLLVDFVF